MKALWTQLCKLGSEWFNVIAVAIVCVLCLFAINYQSSTSIKKLDEIQTLYDRELGVKEERLKNLHGVADALSKIVIEEKKNSQLKSQVIERQQQLIRQLMEELKKQQFKYIDPDTIT